MFGPSNALSAFCNADTDGPVDPRASLGVFGSAGSACHVIGPTTPSGVILFPCWNDLTASCVFGPKLLSTSETFSTLVITKIICSRRTSGPLEPIDKIGPLFMTSSIPQNAPAHNESRPNCLSSKCTVHTHLVYSCARTPWPTTKCSAKGPPAMLMRPASLSISRMPGNRRICRIVSGMMA